MTIWKKTLALIFSFRCWKVQLSQRNAHSTSQLGFLKHFQSPIPRIGIKIVKTVCITYRRTRYFSQFFSSFLWAFISKCVVGPSEATAYYENYHQEEQAQGSKHNSDNNTPGRNRFNNAHYRRNTSTRSSCVGLRRCRVCLSITMSITIVSNISLSC